MMGYDIVKLSGILTCDPLEKEEKLMKVSKGIIKVLSVIILVVLITQIAGCGTILYPERRGQKVHGAVDTKIAVLDAIGLLFFIIPGLIAFGVDFYTGAIYLRPGEKQVWGETQSKQEIVVIRVDPNQLDQKMIEKIVSDHIGQTISLEDHHMQILKFNGTDVNEFKTLLAKIDKRGQITR
jgi:hypothetical protein